MSALTDRPAVLVARRAPDEVLQRLQASFDVDYHDGELPLPPAELQARLQGKSGVYITGTERITAELLDACPALRVSAP